MVLMIALIILVILSALTLTTVRNASSSEAVSGALRTTEMATQAAEIALRHCEQSVVKVVQEAAGKTNTFVTTFVKENILPAADVDLWQSTATWDSTSGAVYVLPIETVNDSSSGTTYRRPPECMVAPLVLATSAGVPSNTASFVITARGFGPEVPAADPMRSRPSGSEVWLQSHITLE